MTPLFLLSSMFSVSTPLILLSSVLSVSTLPAPILQFNASRMLTVCWDASPLDANPTSAAHYYQLQMSVNRVGQPPFHVTRRAAAGVHSLYWPDLPAKADLCFKVALVVGHIEVHSNNLGEPSYSEATCYSSCTCLGDDAPAVAPPPGSCASSGLLGAIIGALLALGLTYYLTRRGGFEALLSYCPKPIASMLRGVVGGAYGALSTAELEMEERSSAMVANTPGQPAPLPRGSCLSAPSAASASSASGGGSVSIAPPPDINAADFELRWSACATRQHALTGRLPSAGSIGALSQSSASDEAEAALVLRGFFCVAAGAVGELHKLYFAGQLGGGSDTWLMIELVLHWRANSVQATFRCDDHTRLVPLAEECAALLAPVLRVQFEKSY